MQRTLIAHLPLLSPQQLCEKDMVISILQMRRLGSGKVRQPWPHRECMAELGLEPDPLIPSPVALRSMKPDKNVWARGVVII